MMNLITRSAEPELMDNPDLCIQQLKLVFNDINRMNNLLLGNYLTKKKVWQIISNNPEKKFRIYDFGCGDGELLRDLSNFLEKRGIDFELLGLDISDKALLIAREASVDYPEIGYAKLNILNPAVKVEPCDILLCSLTMHHFDNQDIPLLLRRFVGLARKSVIINDLKRSRWACLGFKIISTLFLKTTIAKNDGLVSIKSGFLPEDILNLKGKLKKVAHEISWFPNFRFIWSIHKLD